MRTIVLPFAAWLGVLQAFAPPGTSGFSLEAVASRVGLAIGLASLTAGIYRLGVWRQDMENTKSNVQAAIERVARQLEAIYGMLAMIVEFRAEIEKWQTRTERRLHRLETEDVT